MQETLEQRASQKALQLQKNKQDVLTYCEKYHIKITSDEFLHLHQNDLLVATSAGAYKYKEFIVWVE